MVEKPKARPNGLAFSGRLEWTTLRDREGAFIASASQNRRDPAAPLQRRVGWGSLAGVLAELLAIGLHCNNEATL
jgi:hypothetical protein